MRELEWCGWCDDLTVSYVHDKNKCSRCDHEYNIPEALKFQAGPETEKSHDKITKRA